MRKSQLCLINLSSGDGNASASRTHSRSSQELRQIAKKNGIVHKMWAGGISESLSGIEISLK